MCISGISYQESGAVVLCVTVLTLFIGVMKEFFVSFKELFAGDFFLNYLDLGSTVSCSISPSAVSVMFNWIGV